MLISLAALSSTDRRKFYNNTKETKYKTLLIVIRKILQGYTFTYSISHLSKQANKIYLVYSMPETDAGIEEAKKEKKKLSIKKTDMLKCESIKT